MKIGIQLYTLREQLERDFAGTLRQVAECGFQGVEFADFIGYGGMTPQQLKELLDELGLETVGVHVAPISSAIAELDEKIALVKALGSRYLTIGAPDDRYFTEPGFSTEPEAWLQHFADLRKIGEICAAEGLTFSYHNHWFELEEKMEGVPVLDRMMQSVPETVLGLELDACWTKRSGNDPVAYMNQYKSRLNLVHLKDMRRKEDGTVDTVPLGTGEVDLPAVIGEARGCGLEWIVYEQDYCEPSAFEAMKISMGWLREQGVLPFHS